MGGIDFDHLDLSTLARIPDNDLEYAALGKRVEADFLQLFRAAKAIECKPGMPADRLFDDCVFDFVERYGAMALSSKLIVCRIWEWQSLEAGNKLLRRLGKALRKSIDVTRGGIGTAGISQKLLRERLIPEAELLQSKLRAEWPDDERCLEFIESFVAQGSLPSLRRNQFWFSTFLRENQGCLPKLRNSAESDNSKSERITPTRFVDQFLAFMTNRTVSSARTAAYRRRR
jgi:hypothetical protein